MGKVIDLFTTEKIDNIQLIQFGADWCGPCKRAIAWLENNYNMDDLNYKYIDVQKEEDMSQKYITPVFKALNVRSLPTFAVIEIEEGKDGEQDKVNVVDHTVGLNPRFFLKYKAWLDEKNKLNNITEEAEIIEEDGNLYSLREDEKQFNLEEE